MEGVVTLAAGTLLPGLTKSIWILNSHNGKGARMLFRLPHVDVDIDSASFGLQLAKKVKIPFAIPFTMDFGEISIRELLDYCLRTEDQAGWAEFFERIMPTISGVVYNRLARCGRPDRSLAQDLVRDTLVKLLDKNKQALRRLEWPHEDAIYGYVKVIASRVVADHLRRPSLDFVDTPEENLKTAKDSRSSEERFRNRQRCAEVERALEKLIHVNPMEKAIFWFYYRSGYNAREIGEMPDINMSVKRIETILSRLVRQVRAEIERGIGDAASST